MSAPERTDQVPASASTRDEPRSRLTAPADGTAGRAPLSPLRSGDDPLLRALFADHPLPMWIYDLETLRFLEVNDAAVALYGYMRDEFLAMQITEIRPSEDVEPLQSFIDQTVRVRRTSYRPPRLWKHVRKDGAIRDVEVSSHDLTFEGR